MLICTIRTAKDAGIKENAMLTIIDAEKASRSYKRFECVRRRPLKRNGAVQEY